MKTEILYISSLTFSLFLFTSCNSTGYEIEEVEDYSDTSIVTARNEIKQEVEQPKPEIKSDVSVKKEIENTSVITEPKSYIVQLGAFELEDNASAFTRKVNALLNINVSYKFIDGLYKVRTGEYSSKDDAILLLTKLNGAGYSGFIVGASK